MARKLATLMMVAIGLWALCAAGCNHHQDPYELVPPTTPKKTGAKLMAKPTAAQAASNWTPPPEGPVVPSDQLDADAAGKLNDACWADFQQAQYAQAVSDCQDALSADPYAVMPTWNLASAYAALGAKPYALYMLKRLKELEPLDKADVDDKLLQSQRNFEWTPFLQDPQYQAIIAPPTSALPQQ
jgi:hypothetical protein